MSRIAIKTTQQVDITPIIPFLYRFYDARLSNTLTFGSGNNVSSWGDRSLNNVPLTNSTAGTQPVYDPTNRFLDMRSARHLIATWDLNWSGFIYVADAEQGTLEFSFNSSNNSSIIFFYNFNDNVQNFNKIIGIVAATTQSYKDLITAYFNTNSQSLNYSNTSSFYVYFLNRAENNQFFTRRITSFPSINTQNGTNFAFAWFGCSSLTSFPSINTQNGTDFNRAWFGCSSLTSFPSINTQNGTNFAFAWYGCSSLTSFPSINTQNGTNFYAAWYGCSSLTSFPSINTQNGTNFAFAWYGCSSLTSFPSINTQNGTDFYAAWLNCSSLTSLSLDNIFISLAAGYSTRSVTWDNVFSGITNTTTKGLTNIDRRSDRTIKDSFTTEETSTWNNTSTTNLTRSQMVDDYNQLGKSWENTLYNTNENLNGVIYNFTTGNPITGIKCRLWMLAKGWPDIIAAPAAYTTNIIRSYRANSNTTPSSSSTTAANLTGWTPITGTSNQSISASPTLQLQTINGLSCVVFQPNATFTLNNITLGTGNRIWIGGLTGYNFIKPISNITSLTITAIDAYKLISIMISSSDTDDAEVLYRLQFHGSFYQNTTPNFLSISGSTLTISGT